MRKELKVSIIVLLVAVVFGLLGTFYTLEEGQQAVIVQFGRPIGDPDRGGAAYQAALCARGSTF